MELIKKKDKLEVHLDEKVVHIKGHQDSDVFTVFTESVETHPSLTNSDIKKLKEEIKKREDIVIN